ncbi:MAG: N-acetyltransferase family protein [Candidatus Kapaibacterium sp.]
MTNDVTIRLAEMNDTESIVEIYNEGIRNRNNAILDEIELSEYQQEFKKRDHWEYPIFVAIDNHKVIGWISISAYRANRRAYQKSKEVSFYIDSKYFGKGIGSQLLQYVIDHRTEISFDSLFAILVADNQPSISLLKKYNFLLWGYMPKVLDMDGKKEDAIIYGRNFEKKGS